MVEILATKSEAKVTVTVNDMLAYFVQFYSKNNGIGRKLFDGLRKAIYWDYCYDLLQLFSIGTSG